MLKRHATSQLAALAVSGAACPATRTDGPTVAPIFGVKGSPFDDALARGALAEAKAFGPTLTLSAPDHVPAESRAPVIDAVTARAPTVAIISPADSQGVTRPMRQMADLCTKLITGTPRSAIHRSWRAKSSPPILRVAAWPRTP